MKLARCSNGTNTLYTSQKIKTNVISHVTSPLMHGLPYSPLLVFL